MRKVILAVMLGACLFAGAMVARFYETVVHAQDFVQDTGTSPVIQLTPEALQRFWSQQAASRGVTSDADWNTAMGQIFSAANWPGANATSLAFLRSFFVQYVHVGVP